MPRGGISRSMADGWRTRRVSLATMLRAEELDFELARWEDGSDSRERRERERGLAGYGWLDRRIRAGPRRRLPPRTSFSEAQHLGSAGQRCEEHDPKSCRPRLVDNCPGRRRRLRRNATRLRLNPVWPLVRQAEIRRSQKINMSCGLRPYRGAQ